MEKFDGVEDVLRLAISREIEANVFYNLLSQYTDNPQIRTLCIEFAADELEHKAKLELEIMKLGIAVKPYNAPKHQLSLTPLDYMVDMAKIMQMGYEELLLLAMKKEKASFRLYIDLLTLITKPAIREVLIELAEEEAKHKMSFEIEYEMLMAAKNPPPK